LSHSLVRLKQIFIGLKPTDLSDNLFSLTKKLDIIFIIEHTPAVQPY
jgi:hypothetical protein